MVRVKVCGLTNLEDALAAVELGADALGFVFAPSPRRATLQQVADIVAALPPFVCKVGGFVDSTPQQIAETMTYCGLDSVQMHGSESPALCQLFLPRVIKALMVKDESVLTLLPQYKVSAYLLDSYHELLKGGTGQRFDWTIAKRAGQYGPVIVSGGLTPTNVRQAIAIAQPYAVDVSSGVESRPGIKDHTKMQAFVDAVKEEGQKLRETMSKP